MRLQQLLCSSALVLSLGACAAGLGSTPEQKLFGLEQDYRAALVASGVYAGLPRCDAAHPAPCSVQKVVARLDDAAQGARGTLSVAEKLVASGEPSERALSAARSAVELLRSVKP